MARFAKTIGIYSGRTELFKQGEVTVTFTSDDTGETLSLAFEEDCQITVPFEPVSALIQETRGLRAHHKRRKH